MSAAGASDTSSDDTDPTAGVDTSDDSTPQATVLCTIMNNGDGTFSLIAGDDSDDASGASASGDDTDASASSDDAAGAGEGAEGLPPAAGGVAASSAGQTFTSPGPLLKAVLDLVKTAQESGGGSDEDNFAAGFSGDKTPIAKS
jgi:hypothetical protein